MSMESETLKKRMIRRHELRQIVPLADTPIYEMEQRGEFPPPLCADAAMRCMGSGRGRGLADRASGNGPPLDHRPGAASRRAQAQGAAGQIAGSSASIGIEGATSTAIRFCPATQASTMSDHSCIMCRR